MADTSKVFQLSDGLDAVKVGEGIVRYLKSKHQMIAEGASTPEGYFVQAKSNDNGWKKIAGMGKATQVQIIRMENIITVSVGSGEWSDKVGAGVVGAFIFAPLAVTAAVGAWGQKKLVDDIFEFVRDFIVSGGKSVEVTSFAGIGANADDTVQCPSCQKMNPKGQKFCSECGGALSAICPSCKTSVPFGKKFCPECGSPMVIKKLCSKCNAELAENAKFCPECGTPT